MKIRATVGRAGSLRRVGNPPSGQLLSIERIIAYGRSRADNLLNRAKVSTGIEDNTALVVTALRALIAREAAKGLAAFGGTQPDLADIPRRRPQLP
jgi:hypothetical protein